LQPCPDFTCKQNCAGITPIIPQQPYTQPVTSKTEININIWAIIFALIAGALAFFGTRGLKDLMNKKYDGLAISIIFAIVASIGAWWIVSNAGMILAGLGILGVICGVGFFVPFVGAICSMAIYVAGLLAVGLFSLLTWFIRMIKGGD
jgi:hypothetical protein